MELLPPYDIRGNRERNYFKYGFIILLVCNLSLAVLCLFLSEALKATKTQYSNQTDTLDDCIDVASRAIQRFDTLYKECLAEQLDHPPRP